METEEQKSIESQPTIINETQKPYSGNYGKRPLWQWILLYVVIGGIIYAGVYYFFLRNKDYNYPNQGLTPQYQQSTDQSNTLKPTSQIDQKTFQKILTDKCKTITFGQGGSYQVIALNELPILIDQSILKINFHENTNDQLACAIINGPGTGYIGVSFEKNGIKGGLNIYDSSSQEGGHGGPPFLGSYGKVITDDGTTKLSVYLLGGEGPQPIEYVSLYIRGEKKLHLSNGETISVNITTYGIENNNPRLLAFLNKYLTSQDGVTEVDIAPAENAIINYFFKDLTNLQSPEKEKITWVKEILAAVSAK